MAINDIFSKRGKPLPDVFQTDYIPDTLRNQVLWIWKESLWFLNTEYHSLDRLGNPVLAEIHHIICREQGLPYLCDKHISQEADLVRALLRHENNDIVLDIIELSFGCLGTLDDHRITRKRKQCIDELNHRFKEAGVGYQFDMDANKLISVDNLVTHQVIIRPTLQLLAGPDYKTANQEYLDAFDDFKKSDYDDCLAKCGSCFESVMKIVCDKKGWPHSQNDTASTLLNTIISKTGMPPFFEGPLIVIATMRNKLSSAHGSGTQPQQVPEHFARYALNATASAILLIVEATR